MGYELWLIIFGDDAQLTARNEGTPDYGMDDALEGLYLVFYTGQKGELAHEDLVTYGGLLIHSET